MKLFLGSKHMAQRVLTEVNRLRTFLQTGALTDSTSGTPSATTVAAIPAAVAGDAADQNTNILPVIRNNFATLTAKINALCGAIHVSVTGYAAGDPPVQTAVQVTAANATGLATSVTLCNDVIRVAKEHAADAVAHKVADDGTDPLPALSAATNLATGITAANLVRTWFIAHLVDGSVDMHYSNDTVRTVAADVASDQDTLNTLLNELKTDLNAHITAALAGEQLVAADA